MHQLQPPCKSYQWPRTVENDTKSNMGGTYTRAREPISEEFSSVFINIVATCNGRDMRGVDMAFMQSVSPRLQSISICIYIYTHICHVWKAQFNLDWDISIYWDYSLRLRLNCFNSIARAVINTRIPQIFPVKLACIARLSEPQIKYKTGNEQLLFKKKHKYKVR